MKDISIKYDFLLLDLDVSKKIYPRTVKLVEDFLKENPRINSKNRAEYDIRHKDLFALYKATINVSNLDLIKVPLYKRLDYGCKKEFAIEIKPSLEELLEKLNDFSNISEENPFYIDLEEESQA